MTEEMQDAHEEALKPQSEEEKAFNIDLGQSASKIAEDNDKKTIFKVLEINGVTFETLNISKSKFNKMNKEQLINALFEYQKREAEPQKTTEPQAEQVDYIGLLLNFKELILSAKESGDYSKLDGAVGQQALGALAESNTINNIDVNPLYLTRVLLSLATLYFISRMIGFDTIADKINQIKERFINKETVKNEQK